MIISKEFGPQFDPTDGTIGELQLVKRYTLFSGGLCWYPRQGRYTWETLTEAIRRLNAIKDNNARDLVPSDLEAVPVWCCPKHFDPVGAVKQQLTKE